MPEGRKSAAEAMLRKYVDIEVEHRSFRRREYVGAAHLILFIGATLEPDVSYKSVFSI
jgi:hypothetical protein